MVRQDGDHEVTVGRQYKRLVEQDLLSVVVRFQSDRWHGWNMPEQMFFGKNTPAKRRKVSRKARSEQGKRGPAEAGRRRGQIFSIQFSAKRRGF